MSENFINKAKDARKVLFKFPGLTSSELREMFGIEGGMLTYLSKRGLARFEQKRGEPARWYFREASAPIDVSIPKKPRQSPSRPPPIDDVDMTDVDPGYWDKLYADYVPSWERKAT